jgi:hypothetical protein
LANFQTFSKFPWMTPVTHGINGEEIHASCRQQDLQLRMKLDGRVWFTASLRLIRKHSLKTGRRPIWSCRQVYPYVTVLVGRWQHLIIFLQVPDCEFVPLDYRGLICYTLILHTCQNPSELTNYCGCYGRQSR